MQGLETPDKKIERLKYYSTHYDELLQQLSKMSWWQRWKFRKELVYCLPKLADCYTVEAYFERRIYDWSAWWVDFRYKLNSDIFKSEEHYKECVKEYERLSGGKRKITAKDLDNYEGNIFDGVRYLNQHELEKCQCVPKDYTKCLTRNEAADVLGDGWNIEVIKYFFKYIK